MDALSNAVPVLVKQHTVKLVSRPERLGGQVGVVQPFPHGIQVGGVAGGLLFG